MKNIDHLDLDGHALKLLTLVVQLGSVTQAANALGVTQSSVSHHIERLRAITGDPLFVKSGRGIVPTARAQTLAHEAQHLLSQLQAFVHKGQFEPGRLSECFTIAANDLQRDLLLPALLERLHQDAPQVTMRVIASNVPSADMLRAQDCQLVISPRPPDATDIMHRRLFTDRYRVFFDAEQRPAPCNRKAYEQAQHVTVVYQPHRPLEIDDWMQREGVTRQFVTTLSSFSGIASFIKGTSRLATLPGLLSRGLLQGLDDAPVPVKTPEMPMYAIWHIRHQHDPVHAWLRQCLLEVVKQQAA